MNVNKGLSFLDTNVIVYAFERNYSERKRAAQRLISELMGADQLRVSTQVLQEVFVTLTRKAKQPCSTEEALAILEDLSAWPLMVIDYAAIRAAIVLSRQAGISFWDGLIVVAAARSGASVLYTEDLNDGQEMLGVKITTPCAVR
jgi:predicted nucleic acid-binding protein